MTPRETRTSLAAGYQLMASYLVWDLRDLITEGRLSSLEARERLRQFIEMLQAVKRAALPAYPASVAERRPTGSARAERTKRLATLSRDEELFAMVVAARADQDPEGASDWADKASLVLQEVETHNWSKPDEEAYLLFIQNDLEHFLRRLQRIDQLDGYRPAKRRQLSRR